MVLIVLSIAIYLGIGIAVVPPVMRRVMRDNGWGPWNGTDSAFAIFFIALWPFTVPMIWWLPK